MPIDPFVLQINLIPGTPYLLPRRSSILNVLDWLQEMLDGHNASKHRRVKHRRTIFASFCTPVVVS